MADSNASSTSTNAYRNVNNPTQTLVVVVVISTALFLITVLAFSFLRTRVKRLYSPRLLLLEEKMFPLGRLPSSLFAWVSPAIMVNDDDIFGYIGMDALVYLRFLRMALKIAIFTLPFGLIVLLPLNYYGGWDLKEGLDKISMSNVKSLSKKHWAHFLAVWIYSLGVFYLMYDEWKVYVLYRQAHLAKGLAKHYAILVRDIPAANQDEDSFRGYVEELFPRKVSRTYVIKDLERWEKIVAEHNDLVRKLEHMKALIGEQSGKDPRRLSDVETKGVNQYNRKLQILQVQMEEEQTSLYESLPCAVVVFKTLSARTTALQVLWDVQASKYKVSEAPDSCEIIWKNLKIDPIRRNVRFVIATLMLIILISFWTIPIAFVGSLTKFQSLAEKLTFLDKVAKNMSKLTAGLIQGLIPVLLVVLFQAVLPKIIEAIAKFQGLISESQIQMKVFKTLSIFYIINTFFVLSLSGSVFQYFEPIINNPKELPERLGRSLPNQANFYINYVAFLGFAYQGLELTRIVPMISQSIKLKWFAKSPRERLETWKPAGPPYAEMYSNDVLVFLIGLTYSILSPIIVPFVTIYFAYAYVVWTYQVLHVYMPKFEHGGTFWPCVFNRMVGGTFVFQLLMIGVFSLKEYFLIAACLVPLPILTIIYWRFVINKYQKVGEYLALREGKTTREAYDRFLEKITNTYIRNDTSPGIYKVSALDDIYVKEFQEYTSIDDAETNCEMEIKINDTNVEESPRLVTPINPISS